MCVCVCMKLSPDHLHGNLLSDTLLSFTHLILCHGDSANLFSLLWPSCCLFWNEKDRIPQFCQFSKLIWLSGLRFHMNFKRLFFHLCYLINVSGTLPGLCGLCDCFGYFEHLSNSLQIPKHGVSLNLVVVLKFFHLLVGIIPKHLNDGMDEIVLISFLFCFEGLRHSHAAWLALSFSVTRDDFELLHPAASTSIPGLVSISGLFIASI